MFKPSKQWNPLISITGRVSVELYGDTDKESIENGNHPKFMLEFMKSSLLPKETFDEILKKTEFFLSYLDEPKISNNI